MTIKEMAAYINQLDSVIDWCKCEELKEHYKDERSRVFKIYIQCIQDQLKELLNGN